jgi:hypothetical protein
VPILLALFDRRSNQDCSGFRTSSTRILPGSARKLDQGSPQTQEPMRQTGPRRCSLLDCSQTNCLLQMLKLFVHQMQVLMPHRQTLAKMPRMQECSVRTTKVTTMLQTSCYRTQMPTFARTGTETIQTLGSSSPVQTPVSMLLQMQVCSSQTCSSQMPAWKSLAQRLERDCWGSRKLASRRRGLCQE